MSTVKIGSLFDGIGGTPLSAVMAGAEPIWASEIEKWPISITKRHFPNMKHYGDITQINGAEIEPVDIIVGGSPCQDLSVAGKRAGLDGERSGLFMDQCRIIKEMRNAGELRNKGGRNTESIEGSLSYAQECDDSRRESGLRGNSGNATKQITDGSADLPRPRYMVWENVPGAFSSNKGEDFRAVLEEIARIADDKASIPEPPKGKWLRSGTILGDGYSIAWRTVDAQFWGVPQRRRRIYLVADFGGSSAPEICFKPEGVSGDLETSGETRKGTAGDADGGTGAAGECYGLDTYNQCTLIETAFTLRSASGGDSKPAVCYPINTMAALRPESSEQNRQTFGIGRDGDPLPTLSAAHHHAVCYGISSFASNAMKSSNPHSGVYVAKTSKTIDQNGGNPACNQGGIAIVEPVCFDPRSQDGVHRIHGDVVPTLNTAQGGQRQPCVCYGIGCRNFIEHEELYPTLQAKSNGGQSLNYSGAVRSHSIVRRLTPLECERLQGYPDNWTKYDEDGREISDSQRYKALGNSFAVPNAYFFISRIVQVLQGQEEEQMRQVC